MAEMIIAAQFFFALHRSLGRGVDESWKNKQAGQLGASRRSGLARNGYLFTNVIFRDREIQKLRDQPLSKFARISSICSSLIPSS